MSRLLLLPLALLVACGSPGEDRVADAGDRAAEAISDARESISADAEDMDLGTDVPGTPVETITTTGGALDLGLTDAVLFSRLSKDAREEAAREMDEATADQDGLGGQIARAVTGAVAEGLRTAVTVPLDRIQDIRYDGDRLVIEMVSGEPSPFDNAETDGEPMLSLFDPADARRLADAFDRVR